MKHSIKVITKGLLIIFTAAILGFSIFFTMQATFAINTQAVTGEPGFIGGYKPIIIVSGSMEPTIMTNAMCIVEKCQVSDINVDDIVMYKADNGMLVVHRAVAFIELPDGERQIVTKGDANDAADRKAVTSSMLKGKIVIINNDIAPILTSLFSSNGQMNVFSIVRASLIIVLAIIALVLIIKYLTRIVCGVFWVIAGDKRFKASLEKHQKSIESSTTINELLEEATLTIDNKKLNFLDILTIGYNRARIKEYINDSTRAGERLSRQTKKYIKKSESSSKSNKKV